MMAATPTETADRGWVVRNLLPRLLRALAPWAPALDQKLREKQTDLRGLGAGFTSILTWHEQLAVACEGYTPALTRSGYDTAFAQLARNVESLAQLYHTNIRIPGPDRYAEALDTVHRLPNQAGDAAIGLLDVLRGTDVMPEIISFIHAWATQQGHPDWRERTPKLEHFFSRRFTAVLGDDTLVYILATGTSASRLVWRVYADGIGRKYLGVTAIQTGGGLRPEHLEGTTAILIACEDQTGSDPTGDQPMLTSVRDVTVGCSAWAYERLLASVRTYMKSRYDDGHVTEGQAKWQAVGHPAFMKDIALEVTATDIRRAFTEAGWYESPRHPGWWYPSPA